MSGRSTVGRGRGVAAEMPGRLAAFCQGLLVLGGFVIVVVVVLAGCGGEPDPVPPAPPAASAAPSSGAATSTPALSPTPIITPRPTPSPSPVLTSKPSSAPPSTAGTPAPKGYTCASLLEPAAAGSGQGLGQAAPDLGRSHVAVGQQVTYEYCPPASGPHLGQIGLGPIEHRFYGPGEPTLPQSWIHNLEHGAMVVLYRCRSDLCVDQETLAALEAYLVRLPPSPLCDIRPDALLTGFADMNAPVAALVWNQVLFQDRLDPGQLDEFFAQSADRGPEPQCQAAVPSGQPSPSPAATARIDPSLLAILPATVAGNPLVESAELEQGLANTASLGLLAAAFAAGQVADATGTNRALAIVVGLRPVARGDEAFASYRASYDQSACGQAGGVSGSETRQIGGRAVEVTNCANGAIIYHARVREDSVLVSIAAVGPLDFGGQLIGGLRP